MLAPSLAPGSINPLGAWDISKAERRQKASSFHTVSPAVLSWLSLSGYRIICLSGVSFVRADGLTSAGATPELTLGWTGGSVRGTEGSGIQGAAMSQSLLGQYKRQ